MCDCFIVIVISSIKVVLHKCNKHLEIRKYFHYFHSAVYQQTGRSFFFFFFFFLAENQKHSIQILHQTQSHQFNFFDHRQRQSFGSVQNNAGPDFAFTNKDNYRLIIMRLIIIITMTIIIIVILIIQNYSSFMTTNALQRICFLGNHKQNLKSFAGCKKNTS